jgi:hypothetical protein
LEQVRIATAIYRTASTANSGVRSNVEITGGSVRGTAGGSGSVRTTPTALLNPFTTEMALLQPPMQDFLTQADFAFDFPNPVDDLYGTSLLYN